MNRNGKHGYTFPRIGLNTWCRNDHGAQISVRLNKTKVQPHQDVDFWRVPLEQFRIIAERSGSHVLKCTATLFLNWKLLVNNRLSFGLQLESMAYVTERQELAPYSLSNAQIHFYNVEAGRLFLNYFHFKARQLDPQDHTITNTYLRSPNGKVFMYHSTEFLGSGGYSPEGLRGTGVVYKGYDLQTGSPVAIKMNLLYVNQREQINICGHLQSTCSRPIHFF
jgi:hypothetical protein